MARKASGPRLTPKKARNLVGVAKVVAPAVIPVLAPIAARAAGMLSDRYDRYRARRLGVPVDSLGAVHRAGAARCTPGSPDSPRLWTNCEPGKPEYVATTESRLATARRRGSGRRADADSPSQGRAPGRGDRSRRAGSRPAAPPRRCLTRAVYPIGSARQLSSPRDQTACSHPHTAGSPAGRHLWCAERSRARRRGRKPVGVRQGRSARGAHRGRGRLAGRPPERHVVDPGRTGHGASSPSTHC